MEEKGEYSGMPFCVRGGLEETVLRDLCRDKVREVLETLPVLDAELIELLYFQEVTMTEAARLCGCSRRTIQNRRKRILGELRQKIQEQGIKGGYF